MLTEAVVESMRAIFQTKRQVSRQPPLLERYEGLGRVEAYFIMHSRVTYVPTRAPHSTKIACPVTSSANQSGRYLHRSIANSDKDKQAGESGSPGWGSAIVRAVEIGPDASSSPARRVLARLDRKGITAAWIEGPCR